MANIFKRAVDKFNIFTKKVDEYQVELTFAEAGVYETGRDAVEAIKRQEEQRHEQRLLVVGNAGTFSQEIIDYALDMATRMEYEILALSTSDLSCDSFSLFPESKAKICGEFDTLAQENSNIFALQAEAIGVKFSHTTAYSDTQTAIDNINKEIGGVSFVVDEQIGDRTEIGREESRLQNRLFVYSVV